VDLRLAILPHLHIKIEQIMAESELVYTAMRRELKSWRAGLVSFTFMKLGEFRSGYVFKPTVTMNCNECVNVKSEQAMQ
jgi:hypothetical protein